MERGGATPVKLARAGAAMSSLLASVTSTVLLLDVDTLDQFRFWVVGSLTGRDADVAAQVMPFLVVGTLLALRSEEHTSELQSLMRISYAVFCLKKIILDSCT